MKKNGWKIAYIVLFLGIIMIPFAGLTVYEEGISTENRDLTAMPNIKTEEGWNVSFLKEIGAYFEDHFAFRKELVTANSYVVTKGLGVSTDTSVIAGKDNWLYYEHSLADYQGSKLMTERQLFDAAHTLAMMETYTKEKGGKFLLAIAPNKNSLYGENMPYYYQGFGSGQKNWENLKPYLEEEQVTYTNLHQLFEDQDEVLYHTTDSHWNNKGAAMATDSILKVLEKPHSDYQKRDYEVRNDFEGDLEVMLYPVAPQLEDEIYYSPEPQYDYVEEVESNFEMEIHTTSQGEGSLVMYRDSFGNSLLPFMAESYGQAYFSRNIPYNLSDLDICKADTLIVERAERFLPEIAKVAPKMLAPIVRSEELGDVKYDNEIPDLEIIPQGSYTKISGEVPQENLQTKSRLYIKAGVLTYEAFPVTGDDGTERFELYVLTKMLTPDSVYEIYVSQE